MLEVKKNADYIKQVKVSLKRKNPYLYEHITDRQIKGVLNFVTKNICLTMLRNENIYINRFMSLYVTPRIKFKRLYSKALKEAKRARSAR